METELGSESLTVWLSDGSCFPGQLNFRKGISKYMGQLTGSLYGASGLLESVCRI